MKRNYMSSPAMDAKIRQVVRELLYKEFGGTVKIMSLVISSTDTEPNGFTFNLRMNGSIIPTKPEPETETPAP